MVFLTGSELSSHAIVSKSKCARPFNFNDLAKVDFPEPEFPNTIKALQWHSYEVSNLENNHNITIIGSSPSTKYQIFKFKDNAYGIQFHIEVKNNTVSDWGCVPEYKLALEDSLGGDALIKFDNLAKQNMNQMNFLASVLYKKFINLI